MITKTEANDLLTNVLMTLIDPDRVTASDAKFALDNVLKFRNDYFIHLPEDVGQIVVPVEADPVVNEIDPIHVHEGTEPVEEQPKVEQRQIFKAAEGNRWDQVEGLMSLQIGDLFYMVEATGELVKDADGNSIFTATGIAFEKVNEHNEPMIAIECKATPEFKGLGIQFISIEAQLASIKESE